LTRYYLLISQQQEKGTYKELLYRFRLEIFERQKEVWQRYSRQPRQKEQEVLSDFYYDHP